MIIDTERERDKSVHDGKYVNHSCSTSLSMSHVVEEEYMLCYAERDVFCYVKGSMVA